MQRPEELPIQFRGILEVYDVGILHQGPRLVAHFLKKGTARFLGFVGSSVLCTAQSLLYLCGRRFSMNV